MPRRGKLIVISGPSGVGKGTLVREIVLRVPDIMVSVSATTRPRRPGETEGKDYFFISPDEFERRIAAGEFLEWAEVFGNRYGTLKAETEGRLDHGTSVLLEIDVQGARKIKETAGDGSLVCIFIKPPSLDALAERLRGRATDSDEVIGRRLEVAEAELREEYWYDATIVNDSLPAAVDELARVIVKYQGTEVD